MDSLLKKTHDEMTYMFMQFLKEEGQTFVLRKLEQDSAIYFNQGSLGDLIAEGNWDEAEKYISAFTTIEDNQISNQMYFLIRKQKFLEALYKGELTKATTVLDNELSIFKAQQQQQTFAVLREVLRMNNSKNHEIFAGYEDIKSTRSSVLEELKNLISINPKLCDKLDFPNMETSRLKKVIHQGLCWQHSQCINPKTPPEISSLFIDHNCDEQGASQPSSYTLTENGIETHLPKEERD